MSIEAIKKKNITKYSINPKQVTREEQKHKADGTNIKQ